MGLDTNPRSTKHEQERVAKKQITRGQSEVGSRTRMLWKAGEQRAKSDGERKLKYRIVRYSAPRW